ncbi:MAG: hypothetical protein IJ475_03300 [Bacilli bacterium]|nr:hypothetical protein [Bacilli bacterium]
MDDIGFFDRILFVIRVMVLIFLFFMLFVYFYNFVFYKPVHVNDISIFDVDVVSYEDEILKMNITPSEEQVECAVSKNILNSFDDLTFNKLVDNSCLINVEPSSYYVYFKDDENTISKPLLVSDYIVDVSLKDRYYLPIGGTVNLKDVVKIIGNVDYELEYDSSVVSIADDVLTALANGEFILKFKKMDEVFKEVRIVVTDGIVLRPNIFNSKKSFLGCRVYDSEKAKLMDEILEFRIAEAGYGTRAGVVEAARFLTLEFPYKIRYFYENGRVSNTGVNKVDGEGRYYHKGLYLHEDKFADIKYTFSGKAIWGCGLRNNEPNQPDYPRNAKLPNGLDCSGFVTWAILNGGFDVGDIGAGESPAPNQLTDTGEFRSLSMSLINSGKIKVGDLFNFWGHIAILIGEDDKNYYIAESLNTYFGVVVKTYPKNKVMNTFTHVVLMDDYYKEDGNLTKMWY